MRETFLVLNPLTLYSHFNIVCGHLVFWLKCNFKVHTLPWNFNLFRIIYQALPTQPPPIIFKTTQNHFPLLPLQFHFILLLQLQYIIQRQNIFSKNQMIQTTCLLKPTWTLSMFKIPCQNHQANSPPLAPFPTIFNQVLRQPSLFLGQYLIVRSLPIHFLLPRTLSP